MSVAVLTAVTDPGLEASLVAAFGHPALGVTVVRRCVDLADLLAAAATGTARAVLVSGDLRRLDREALARLLTADVVPVGLVRAGDEAAERRLRQLGVETVLTSGAGAPDVAAALVEAAGRPGGSGPSGRGWADPLAALPAFECADDEDGDAAHSAHPPGREDALLPPGTSSGRIVAVWGPTGAPGRSSLAWHLAAEAALLGARVLLVDADPYGGATSTLAGALDETPGLPAACRTANAGLLDVARLAALCRTVPLDAAPAGSQPAGSPPAGRLLLLTGAPSASRWAEQRAAAVEAVLDTARRVAEIVVVDVGFSLESDEELAYDTLAPRRNGATLTALDAADLILAVGSADPLGMQRLVRGLAELADAVPGAAVEVVVNRLRGSVIPGDAREQVDASLLKHAGVTPLAHVPDDPAAFDAALVTGRTLAEVAPGSAARTALRALAAGVSGREPPVKRRRSWRRGGRRPAIAQSRQRAGAAHG